MKRFSRTGREDFALLILFLIVLGLAFFNGYLFGRLGA